LYILYVDDSGSPSVKDNTSYYVISGVIIHETDINQMEREVQQYKSLNFIIGYKNAEIHVHDIYKSQRKFSELTRQTKYELLDNLYSMINTLPITTISVGISKVQLLQIHPDWDVFNAAWTFLTERFDKFVSDHGNSINKGIIIDRSSKIPEKEIWKIVNRLRRYGSYFQSIDNIVEEPIFVESQIREGIQLADACAYCTVRYLNGSKQFLSYWDVVESKLRRSKSGIIPGYGLKIFAS
jgi:hypothetical protein